MVSVSMTVKVTCFDDDEVSISVTRNSDMLDDDDSNMLIISDIFIISDRLIVRDTVGDRLSLHSYFRVEGRGK
jgi:hypothetical protein